MRGYHPQIASCAETNQVIFSRLRGGNAGAARGAKSFLTETVSRLRHAGATGALTVRADSAFHSKKMLSTARGLDVRFSVTAWFDCACPATGHGRKTSSPRSPRSRRSPRQPDHAHPNHSTDKEPPESWTNQQNNHAPNQTNTQRRSKAKSEINYAARRWIRA